MSRAGGEGPFMLSSFPQAVLHCDGDAFFTSVEQSIHPELKNRPVVSGKERGIIACASYEAKALGIKRGLSLWEARERCPDLVVLPSDYELYSLYSKRMFAIMRRYTPAVEEYSIDEGFADVTGLCRMHRCSYEEMARRMKEEIQRELDLTVSVGVSVSKSVAKLASKYRKPDGLTVVRGQVLHLFLERTPLSAVWGLGRQSNALLQKFGVYTALDFVRQEEAWVSKQLGKPGREIWQELRGQAVYAVETEEKSRYLSISKTKTFTAVSSERPVVWAKLLRNVESAFIKLRRHGLCARSVAVSLRRRDYVENGLEIRLSRPTSATHEVLPLVRQLFAQLYESEAVYRTTSVVLGLLTPSGSLQYELFDDILRIEKQHQLSGVMDRVNRRYGKHTLSLGTALHLHEHAPTDRDEQPWRRQALLPGETPRRRLHIPRLDIDLAP